MPRVCTICTHAEREAINAALVAGEPFRVIAQRFATSPDAVYRHKQEHLPAIMVKSEQAKEVAHADTLVGQVQNLRNKAISILETAEKAGDLRVALLGIREARACIELLAEMEGEINRRPVFNFYMSAEWIEVRAVLLHALGDFPEARAAAALALRGGASV
jgi:DNA polymerase III delta prime subunit